MKKAWFPKNIGTAKMMRIWAILWTLLIFLLCLIPSKEIPKVDIPLVDKWAHIILFAIFSLLWLFAIQKIRPWHLLVVFLTAVAVGILVELIQGSLGFLGRRLDKMDMVADGLGGAAGVLAYVLIRAIVLKKQSVPKQ